VLPISKDKIQANRNINYAASLWIFSGSSPVDNKGRKLMSIECPLGTRHFIYVPFKPHKNPR
jgi:hypothetical protein